ncbi:putative retrotransposon ty1-copia subclass protein [Tanacetum coccineum]
MNAKMKSIRDNQVLRLVDLPPNGQTFGSKWLFKKNTDMEGNVHTFKARLVVKGYTQTYGSAKQSTIAMSFTEAEYIVAPEASMEAVSMRKFIDGLGNVMPTSKEPLEILCDNTGVTAIANDPRIMKRARHY